MVIKRKISKTLIFAIIGLGILLVMISAFYASSLLAIIGITISFWGAIFSYIQPEKFVPVDLLNAVSTANSSNIERILIEANSTKKAVYLPPNKLKSNETSLIFLADSDSTILPMQVIEEKLFSEQTKGVFLTPPGHALCQLLEHKSGLSFMKIDLPQLQQLVPSLFTETIELAEKAFLTIEKNVVIIQLVGCIFSDACRETSINQPKTHVLVGCIISSALACVVARTTGKPVVIQKETLDEIVNTLSIEYLIREE